jgi:orotidine-5'-phosphate decarboxylase
MIEQIDEARAKLIVALDVDTAARARELVAQLRDSVGMFKIGLQLFTAEGPTVVRELAEFGVRIFLDLKFHDIPQTVASAGIECARLGVFMFNLHASGGREMMVRTVGAVSEVTSREGLPQTKIIAVTVLTSLDGASLASTGIPDAPECQALRLGKLAEECGLDGVVASPLEAAALRDMVGGRFLLVTPGVRPAGATHDDQRRVFTPSDAVKAGADYLVVGRPILKAPDPVRAARKIVEEVQTALNGREIIQTAGAPK